MDEGRNPFKQIERRLGREGFAWFVAISLGFLAVGAYKLGYGLGKDIAIAQIHQHKV